MRRKVRQTRVGGSKNSRNRKRRHSDVSEDALSDDDFVRKPRKAAKRAKQKLQTKKSFATGAKEDDLYLESPVSDSEDEYEGGSLSDGSATSDEDWEESGSNFRKSRTAKKKLLGNRVSSRSSGCNFKFKDHLASSHLNKLFEEWKDQGSAEKSSKALVSQGDSKKKLPRAKPSKTKNLEMSSSGSEDEWEDVYGGENIVITIQDTPKVLSQKEKEANEARQEVIRRLNQRQANCHKVHLLCYIAHLRFWARSLVMNTTVKALCLSVVPSNYLIEGKKKFDVSFAKRFMKWFTSAYSRGKVTAPTSCVLPSNQMKRLEVHIGNKTYEDDKDVALILFTTLLALRQAVRLVVSCQPMAYKKKLEDLIKQEISMCRQADCKGGKQKCEHQLKNKRSEKAEKNGDVDHSEKAAAVAVEGITDSGDKDIEVQGSDGKKPTRKSARHRSEKPTNKAEADGSGRKSALTRNYWIEYWDNAAKSWICLDPWNNKVNSPESIEGSCTLPMHYVLAIDNVLAIRDVTARYASKYFQRELRVARVDAKWWNRTLEPWLSKNEPRVKLEDRAIQEYLMSKGMPETLSGFKNHPLYVLDKDVLKYEAIYPPDVKPFGKFRDCKVYLRSDCYNLQSELNWLKEIRSIKKDEKPYKMVPARFIPKARQERCPGRMTGLFGFWQTEPFKPPEVVKGRIPRNEHGNIYLFKMCMLPKGCAYLRLEGLYGLARRCDIECAPCVVGWDFHKGCNHPVVDGCAVLAKDEKKLRRAWAEEYDKKRCRADQRRRERAKRNWRRLFKGVTLMKKLRAKFLGDQAQAMDVDEKLDNKEGAVDGDTDNAEAAEDDFISAWPHADYNLPLAEKVAQD